MFTPMLDGPPGKFMHSRSGVTNSEWPQEAIEGEYIATSVFTNSLTCLLLC